MRYQHFGKTSKVTFLGMTFRVIHIVCAAISLLLSFLTFAWGLLPLPYWLNVGLTFGVTLTLGKVSEVPFCKEMLFNPLTFRVSFDP